MEQLLQKKREAAFLVIHVYGIYSDLTLKPKEVFTDGLSPFETPLADNAPYRNKKGRRSNSLSYSFRR